MIRAYALALVATLACGRSSGVSDEQLGNLVVEPKQADSKIDVARAADDPAELGRALARPYTKLLGELGPHVLTIKTSTIVEEAGKAVSQLTDETTLEHGEGDAFRGVYANSADYGREVVFTGGQLYLRPRYQRWHRRAPETATEPAELRAGFAAAIPATWELVGHAAELTDRGTVQVAGRSGRKIEVKLSPAGAKPPREPLAQRKWREGRSVEALTGHVTLDAETGAPLAIELAASIGFSRDGRSFVMKVQLASQLANLGQAAAIAAPPEGETVATPTRMREVDERDYLLDGLAPPIRSDRRPAKPERAKPEAKP